MADPAPSLITEAITAIFEQWLETNWIPDIITNRVFLTEIEPTAKTKVGGRYLNGNVAVKSPKADTETGRIGDLRDPIPLSGPSAMRAQYTWARYGRRPGIDYGETEDNRGAARIVDLMTERLNLVLQDIQEDVSTDFFSIAQTQYGLQSFYVAMTTAAGVALGGILVGLGWTPILHTTTHATAPVANSTIATDIKAAYRAIRNHGGRPSLFLLSPTVYTKLEAEVGALTVFQANNSDDITKIGFGGYKYQGAKILEEPAMEEEAAEGAGGSGDVMGWFLAIDTQYNYPVRSRNKPLLIPFKDATAPVEGYQCLWSIQNCLYSVRRAALYRYTKT